MTASIQTSTKPEIEYPDDDGEPMSDNTSSSFTSDTALRNITSTIRTTAHSRHG